MDEDGAAPVRGIDAKGDLPGQVRDEQAYYDEHPDSDEWEEVPAPGSWSSLVLNTQTRCRRHGVPYVHGCVWDRECRSDGAPLRVSLMLGRTMLWVDLPRYYRDLLDDHRMWHGLSFGHYTRTL